MIGESTAEDTREIERLTLIETNIDDASPQILGHVMERAFAVGALDCWFTPIMMKKNRPATMISILCGDREAESLKLLIYNETTSIGLRVRNVDRECLDRNIEKVVTDFGTIDVKVSRMNGSIVNRQAEYESARIAAIRHGIPLKSVIDAVNTIFDNRV
jgi:uncharacterized protein (DUF111 family)